MMQHQRGSKRGGLTRPNGVVSRMRVENQVKGGAKSYNAKDEAGVSPGRRLGRIRSDTLAVEKRKTWKVLECEKSPIVLRKTLSEPPKETVSIQQSDGGREDETDNCPQIGVAGGEEVVNMEVETEKEEFEDIEVDEEVEIEIEESEKRIEEIYDVPITSIVVKKASDMVEESDPPLVESTPMEVEVEVEEIYEHENLPHTHNNMQHIVDLVMWREVSKSGFVFGTGSFVLVSSSYTKDFSFSLISAFSYLGLLYLAAIFIYKSILHRGGVGVEERNDEVVFGEEEAAWLMRKLLPYINELLVKAKALFSGDPSTTMKMAMFLFALARCGDSITIWTMTKLAFFGIFTIPRLVSAYSDQITRYGKFLLDRSRDAWDTCTHKKAAAGAAFVFMWNFSTPIARTWVVFMLLIALKYYQQSLATTTANWDENYPQGEEKESEIQFESSIVEENPKQNARHQYFGKIVQNCLDKGEIITFRGNRECTVRS